MREILPVIMQVTCGCGHMLRVRRPSAGAFTTCPHCRQRFVIPPATDGRPAEARPGNRKIRMLAIALLVGICLPASAWFLFQAGAAKKPFVGADRNTPTNAAPLAVQFPAGVSNQQTSATAGMPARDSRPLRSEPYRDIDRHALKAPKEAEQSVETLAKYLVGPAQNDREKVRAIFRWIADRVAYDVEAYFDNGARDDTAAGVLERRKGVCAGYANLFQELCTSAGIEAVVVDGDAKGASLAPGDDVGTESHAWNAVKLDGVWHLLDVTWCAGFVEGKTFCKEFKESYYLPMPEQMILDHLPSDPAWQLLSPPVSAEDFAELLQLKRGMRPLVALHRELVEKLRDKTFRGFLGFIDVGDPHWIVRKAPLGKHLQAGSKHRYSRSSPMALSMPRSSPAASIASCAARAPSSKAQSRWRKGWCLSVSNWPAKEMTLIGLSWNMWLSDAGGMAGRIRPVASWFPRAGATVVLPALSLFRIHFGACAI